MTVIQMKCGVAESLIEQEHTRDMVHLLQALGIPFDATSPVRGKCRFIYNRDELKRKLKEIDDL